MANANTPRGLSPVGTITGAAYNEQGRLYAIANDGTNTYAIGDIVKVAGSSDANGVPYVTKAATTDTPVGVVVGIDRKSTRLNSSHSQQSRMPSSA